MNRPDDEFDEFLSRRKPIFRAFEDPLEPPEELDRLVLHQAREAVEGARPQRMYKGPRFVAPIAIAATLVLAVTVILNVGMQAKPQPTPEVTVQTVAQRVEYPAAAPAAPANNAPRRAAESPAKLASDASDSLDNPAAVELNPAAAPAPPSGEAERVGAGPPPDSRFRGDSKTWLAEIERLRAAGESAQADAEYAEYKRQHRAYAVSPDR